MRRREKLKRLVKRGLHRLESLLARAPWNRRPATSSMDTVSSAPAPSGFTRESAPSGSVPAPIPVVTAPAAKAIPEIPVAEGPATFAGRSTAYDGPVPAPQGLPDGAVAQQDPWENVKVAPVVQKAASEAPVEPPRATAEPEIAAPAPQSAPNAPAEDGPALDDDAKDLIVQKIVAEIETVFDPEIPVNIYELGLIYAIKVHDRGTVDIEMTLTSPNCPSAQELPAEVKEKAEKVVGSGKVGVDIVWEPTWGPEKMSEAARLELNIW